MSDSALEINLTRKFLKERLQRDLTTFRGHQDKWQNIHDLLVRTAGGESNSLLLIGPRGSGKTTLIKSVLYQLLQDVNFYKNTIFVHLNGLLETDDKIALKSITVQMNLENAVDGKVFGSFAENLSYLLSCFRSGSKKSKSIIFILEEFDLFCNHHNQTLLYNLFDISQSAQAPICVLGITCRLDVIELLEKRVKSRYSHRQIFIFNENCNLEKRIELFKELLKLPNEKEFQSFRKNKPDFSHVEKKDLFIFRNLFDPTKYEFTKKYINYWNKELDSLAEHGSVKNCIEGLCDCDVSEEYFKTFIFRLVAILNENHPTIRPEDVSHLYKVHYSPEADDKVLLLTGLSVLELCIIIAMKHHSVIYDRDPFNFEIIYGRFSKFAKRSTIMQGVERPLALKAFEILKNLEFILPINANSCKMQKDFQMHKLALTYKQIDQAMHVYQALPTEVSQWYQNSLL